MRRYNTVWIKIQKKRISLYGDKELIKSYPTDNFAPDDMLEHIAERVVYSAQAQLTEEDSATPTKTGSTD